MARKSSILSKQKKVDNSSANDVGVPNDGAAYLKSLENAEIVEYVRCKLNDAYILKAPISRPDSGWKATELKEELWKGTIKVVDRDSHSVIVLVDNAANIFAVWPIEDDDTVERCTDSSRYFIVKTKDASIAGYKFIAIAFNERTDAFEFNVALQTSKREREDRMTRETLEGMAEINTNDEPHRLVGKSNVYCFNLLWNSLRHVLVLPCSL